MSIAFGYDLKKGDRMVEAPNQVIEFMKPFPVPGPALVNYLPFRAPSGFIHTMLVVPNDYFQCGAFLRGSHTSATNHWHEKLESWLRG